MKTIRREVLSVSGAAGLAQKALQGLVIGVAFVYTNGNSSTNAEVFEQVGSYRKLIATNDGSATDTWHTVQEQSRNGAGTLTGSYAPHPIAGNVKLEVDSGNANQTTEVFLWIIP